jgi:hypothetical protein
MQRRQAEMSAQLLMAFVQPDDSKSGQLETLPQPIEASESSSPPAPQILSAPPHDLAMLDPSFVAAVASVAAALGSVVQTVEGGNCPLVLPSSHLSRAFVRACTYLAEAFANPRSHLIGSALAVVEAPTTADTSSATTNERLAWLVMSSPPSCAGTPPGGTGRMLWPQMGD